MGARAIVGAVPIGWKGTIKKGRRSELMHRPLGDLLQALADPNVVHVNMLRGTIARPSLAQIIHIYGADALRAALPPPSDETT